MSKIIIITIGIILLSSLLAPVLVADELDVIEKNIEDLLDDKKLLDKITNNLYKLKQDFSQTNAELNQVQAELKRLDSLKRLHDKKESAKDKRLDLKVKSLEDVMTEQERRIELLDKLITTTKKSRRLEEEIEKREKILSQLYNQATTTTPNGDNQALFNPSTNLTAIKEENLEELANRLSYAASTEGTNLSQLAITKDLAGDRQIFPIGIRNGNLKEQLEFLVFLLRRGFNSSGDLNYFTLLDPLPEKTNFILISSPNTTLSISGAELIVINDPFLEIAEVLRQEFPSIPLLRPNELFNYLKNN